MPFDETANKFAEILDDRYDRWDIYRVAPLADQARGGWIVKLPDECIRGATITEALQNASEFVPLPRYPRPPRRLMRELFVPYKAGNIRWRLKYDGDDYCVQVTTKKAAVEAGRRSAARSTARYDEWLRTYGDLVEAGKEGVDFRWSS